jgi:zinc protease
MKEKRPSKRGPSPFFLRNTLFLFLILFVLCVAGRVYGMSQFTLDDRLSCVFEQRKGTGVAAIQIWVKVGSRYEQPRQAGITHFIEHLIFKGTEKVKGNEMASRIESLGGNINAFTSYDNTVYHIVVPSMAFNEGLDLLADAVRNPSFPAEEVEKEKKVVLEEIKMGEDDPQRKLYKEFLALVYEGRPYARPIIGFAETVSAATRADIVEYHRYHYVPENMVVVIVGEFDEEKAKGALRKALLAGKKTARPSSGAMEDRKPGKDGTVRIIEKDVRESYLVFSYPVPLVTHEDIPALDVMATILGLGESSRLQQELKNKQGVATSISSGFFFPRIGESLFLIYATFKGSDYCLITKGFDEEVRKLVKSGADPWEMEKAKNIIKASYIYGEETAQGRARLIGNFLTLTDNPHFIDQYLKKVDAVTNEDIKRVLGKYLAGHTKSLAVLVPKKTSNPHTYRLENGMTYAINRNPASPSFSFRIGFVGGLKEEGLGKNGIFNLLSKMLLRGTKGKDAAAIAREIGLLAGNISPFPGRSTFGLTGSFLSQDTEKALTLLRELLLETAMKEKELKTAKDEVFSEIRQRDDDPIMTTFAKFNETIYGAHPYGKDPTGTEKDVEGISLKELEGVYGRCVSPENAVLAVSGDVDEKELKSLMTRLFSGWKGPVNMLKKGPVEPPLKREAFVKKEISQTHLVFGFPGPGLTDDDRYGLEVMTAILSGMGGRIHKILREEKPYAYALTFFNQMAYEAGAMGIYIGTDKRHTKEVEAIIRAEIERLRKDGFTEQEVANAKNRLIGNHYIRMQSNGAMSMNMCHDTMYGLKAGFFKEWPSRIEKVKKDDVDRVARKYLTLETMVRITMGAEE